MEEKVAKKSRLYTGEVVSDKMDKTIVVKTERTYTYPLFDKIVKQSKKYKVHDEQGLARVGDIVEFYEGRPLSKTKYMYLSGIVKSHS